MISDQSNSSSLQNRDQTNESNTLDQSIQSAFPNSKSTLLQDQLKQEFQEIKIILDMVEQVVLFKFLNLKSSSELMKVKLYYQNQGKKCVVFHKQDQEFLEFLKKVQDQLDLGQEIKNVSIKNHNGTSFENQCQSFLYLIQIFDVVSQNLRPVTLQSRKIENEFIISSGKAESDSVASCFWDSKLIQDSINQFEINVLLKKNGVSQELNYISKLENQNLEGLELFMKEKDDKLNYINISQLIQIRRLAELSEFSFQQDEKIFSKIRLSFDQEKQKNKWITLGSGAGINGDALIDPCLKLGTSEVIGCLAGYSSDPQNFVQKYPWNPTIAFKSVQEIKDIFQKDDKLFFYYPTVPSKSRDENSIQLLSYFKNSILLMEKPSHNRASEAKEFYDILKQSEIETNRVLVGMHTGLHKGVYVLQEQVEKYKDQIKSVHVKFNYPKNPHAPGDQRTYDVNHGGAMLDLGVYVFQTAKDIGKTLGIDLHEFDKNNKKIFIKKTQLNVDYEVEAHLKYGEYEMLLETCINPGTDHIEEMKIFLKNGDKITQNWICHLHCSNGLFIEHQNGTCTQIQESVDKKETYTYQIEHCEKTMERFLSNEKDFQASHCHSLENSIYLLEFMDLLRENITSCNI